MKNSEKLIVALDVANLNYAYRLVGQLADCVQMFKIGNQFFTSFGPAAVRMLLENQKRIFLDLKFHDIPNTVARAAEAATELCSLRSPTTSSYGVDMFNVHAAGGTVMMRAAAEATKARAEQLSVPKPLVLGVTMLTSIDEKQFQSDFETARKLIDQVAYFAELAQRAGLDGVVASPHEIDVIRKTCGEDFVIVTPSVRPSWAAKNDQSRVMTPAEAIARGANYIVVGRPIYASPNPKEAVLKILQEIDDDC
ncbi:orotidine-5'-phosphate decarboxylase [Candidatus Poribacteria bacterium]|nr:orotidine-5'-phosphate decarboxylase [Candidatus Poribacteria bacterium]